MRKYLLIVLNILFGESSPLSWHIFAHAPQIHHRRGFTGRRSQWPKIKRSAFNAYVGIARWIRLTLRQKQSLFARLICELIPYIFDQGI